MKPFTVSENVSFIFTHDYSPLFKTMLQLLFCSIKQDLLNNGG